MHVSLSSTIIPGLYRRGGKLGMREEIQVIDDPILNSGSFGPGGLLYFIIKMTNEFELSEFR